ncbi:MAG: HAD family phosphatase [Candidatus Omnitrophota bacterium]
MIKENRITTLIFDLGNCLVDFDHKIAANRIKEFTDKSIEEIFNLFFDSGITGIFEEGKISPEGFFLEVKALLNAKITYEQFLPIWNEIFVLSQKNKDLYILAKALKKDYKLAVLSNINILHFEYIEKNFSVFDAFDNVITSYQLGARKPQVEIYNRTLEMLNTPAECAFYTDDRPELIKAASKLGIKAFVFVGVEQFKKDLLKSGININLSSSYGY